LLAEWAGKTAGYDVLGDDDADGSAHGLLLTTVAPEAEKVAL
jgi:hypothetical protein